MKKQKEKMDLTGLGVLSVPQAMLDAAGISSDSDLTVEAIPGVLLIGESEPLQTAVKPLLELLSAIGIEPGEVAAALEKGGYFNE